MKKVAIFVEGQTEKIFVTELLRHLYGYENVDVVDAQSRGKKRFVQLKAPKPHYSYYFLIVDAGAGNKVTSDVLENCSNMRKNGYAKVLGLRDLFPNKHGDKGKVLHAIEASIAQRNIPSEFCKIILAIMETEAWFLADHHLFGKIDGSLTPDRIHRELQYDLQRDDPEIAYEHPAKVIEKIYGLAGKTYGKHEKDAYQLANAMDYKRLRLEAREGRKIASFFLFLDELQSL